MKEQKRCERETAKNALNDILVGLKKPDKVDLSVFGSDWYYRIKNNHNCADLKMICIDGLPHFPWMNQMHFEQRRGRQ